MSLLKKLVGLTIGAAAVGAAAYFLNRNEHTEEYEAPAAPEETAAAPVEEAPEAEAAPVQAPAGDDTPNANPVELGAVEVPKTEDGKLDVTKIADPADFGDWDEQGCKG